MAVLGIWPFTASTISCPQLPYNLRSKQQQNTRLFVRNHFSHSRSQLKPYNTFVFGLMCDKMKLCFYIQQCSSDWPFQYNLGDTIIRTSHPDLFCKKSVLRKVTATGLEPRTTQFLNEHSTIWPNIECGFTLKRVRDMTRTYSVLRNFAKFTGKHLCQSLFFNIKEETLAQVFSCEFCEISKNPFPYRTPLVAVS